MEDESNVKPLLTEEPPYSLTKLFDTYGRYVQVSISWNYLLKFVR